MGRGQLKSSSEGLDKMGIDQAAQTLRDTLAFATIEAKIPSSSITVESLQGTMPLSPLSSTINSASSPFPSPGLSSTEFNVGLGLKMEETSAPEAIDEKRLVSNIVNQRESLKEPSLYAAIFGQAYSRLPSRKQSTPPKTTIRPLQAKSLSPHVRQGSSAQLEKVALSPRLSYSPNQRQGRPLHKVNTSSSNNREGLQFARPISSPSQQRRESAGISTPARGRMRSAGGSLLPNGHPASSLAQDLGIASDSLPRSRGVSRDYSLMSDAHQRYRNSHGENETNTTPPRSSRSLADSTFATPEKRGSRTLQSEGNEAAAHSLLDLAKSPSPYTNRHLPRFAGATPSLEGLVDYSHISPRSKLIDLYETSAALRKSKSVHEMGSPPMTPPRSIRRQKVAFGGEDAESEDSSPCPDQLSSTRKGSVVLLSDIQQQMEEDKKSSRHLSEPLQATHHHQTAYISETPRTPPPLSAPSTPKAPGSNFCYGDFLHTSPSPQPRMRINSSSGTPRITSLLDTPTRGTKSHSRFLNFGSLVDVDEEAPLTELEMSDVLTPGKRLLDSSPRLSTSVKKARIHS